MIQLTLPHISVERTTPFREINSFAYPNPYYYRKHQLLLKFYDNHSSNRTSSRMKKFLFKGKKTIPCCYCEKSLSFNEATVEHIIAKANGGPDKKDNVTISCAPCNNTRQHYSFDDWKKIVNSPLYNETNVKTVKVYQNMYLVFYDYLKSRNRLIERKYLK